jgi:hypothetical protein
MVAKILIECNEEALEFDGYIFFSKHNLIEAKKHTLQNLFEVKAYELNWI